MTEKYSREDLISICEAAVVPVEKWSNRDSPSAHEKVGLCWVMLKAGCEFQVIYKSALGDNCVTDEKTIWLRIRWPSFSDIEWGEPKNCSSEDLFYLPTTERLEETKGQDWY